MLIAINWSLMFLWILLNLQGDHEFESTELKNCDKNSIFKLLPNSWFKINKKCEFIANVCHNITKVLKPVRAFAVLYQNKMKLVNKSRVLSCEILKTIADQPQAKTAWALNGLRLCDEQKEGVFCRNSTAFKYGKDGVRIVKMMTMAIASGENYRFRDITIFEKGERSCIEAKVVARRIKVE